MSQRRLPSRRGILAGMAGLPAVGALTLSASDAAGAGAEPPSRAANPRDYGAVGDGRADDTEAFRAMHRALRRVQDEGDHVRPPRFLIELPPGTYRYSWNRWLWGLRDVTVLGYGATLLCDNRGKYTIDRSSLVTNRQHYWTWTADDPAYRDGEAPEEYGDLIRTARPGDEAVEVLDPAAASHFLPGRWILVQSYVQQQAGFPPNVRYFERAIVRGIDGGLLRLDRPLRHLHREDWPERASSPTSTGRARVVPIDRPDCPLALQQTFLGLTIAPHPDNVVDGEVRRQTAETFNVCGVLDAVVKDCDIPALLVTQAGRVRLENCRFDFSAPDKVVEHLILDNCRVGTLNECTGIQHLSLRNCDVPGNARMFSRKVTVESCRFTHSTGPGEFRAAIDIDGPNPTRSLTLSDCRFYGKGDDTSLPIGGPAWMDVPVDGEILRPDGPDRLRAGMASQVGASLVNMLEEGGPVQLVAGDQRHAGLCRAIRGEGDDVVVAFDLPVPLAANHILRIPHLTRLTVRECTFETIKTSLPRVPRLTWNAVVEDSRRLSLLLDTSVAVRTDWVPGLLRRLSVQVVRPHTGPGGSAFLQVTEKAPKSGRLLLTIDLTRLGLREVCATGAHLLEGDRFSMGGQPAESLGEPPYLESVAIQIVPRPAATPTALPGALFRLDAEMENGLSTHVRAGLA